MKIKFEIMALCLKTTVVLLPLPPNLNCDIGSNSDDLLII